MKTFQEAFEALPREDKAEIARGMIYFLCGALSQMDNPTKTRLEELLFAAMRSAKETHKTGK